MPRVYGPGGHVPGQLSSAPDHLSYSQITRLSPYYKWSCPRAWAYDKLLGLSRVEGAGLICGKAIDKGLQAFFTARKSGMEYVKAYADGEAAVNAYCAGAPWPDPSKREAYQASVTLGFSALMNELASQELPAEVQSRHEFTVRGYDGNPVTMWGVSDWITPTGTIVDLKWTGTARWDKDGNWNEEWLNEYRGQLVGYWLARLAEAVKVATAVPVVARGRLVVVYGGLRVRTPQVRSIDLVFTELDREALVERIREADAVANGPIHPPRPGQACQFCSYVGRCQADNARLAVPSALLATS